jgi:hypothetical protein
MNFHDLSNSELIDRIGRLGVELKRGEELVDGMRAELIKRGVRTGDKGLFFEAQRVEAYVQTTFDRKALEADRGEAFVTPYLKFISVKATIKVKPRTDVVVAKMAAE